MKPIEIIKHPEWPDGLILYKNLVPPKAADFMFNKINTKEGWLKTNKLKRKVKHYGYEYAYTLREPITRKLKKNKRSSRIFTVY